ncbi:MAG: hypothetical protein GY710_08910 [Desulfobacteraceae bacterium]|nr:hypothetical protein [Desulfobacteraceae bacterium]
MLKKLGITYEYHHIGIPTTEKKSRESYSIKFDTWTCDVSNSRVGAQFHRFGPNHPFHPLIAKYPHIAFKVNNIEKVIENEEIIMPLHEPIPGFKSVMINDAGLPVEFIQTDLSQEELEGKIKSGQSVMRDLEDDDLI